MAGNPIKRCNISLDLMLQPMLHQKPTFRPMVVDVFARDVAMPVAIRKALSDASQSSMCGPGGGSDVATGPPSLEVAQGQCFPPGRGTTAIGKMIQKGTDREGF